MYCYLKCRVRRHNNENYSSWIYHNLLNLRVFFSLSQTKTCQTTSSYRLFRPSFRHRPQWGNLERSFRRLPRRPRVPHTASYIGRRSATEIGRCPGKIVGHTTNTRRRLHRREKTHPQQEILVSIGGPRERLSACWVSSNRYRIWYLRLLLYCCVMWKPHRIKNKTEYSIRHTSHMSAMKRKKTNCNGTKPIMLFLIRTLCLRAFQWNISGQDWRLPL